MSMKEAIINIIRKYCEEKNFVFGNGARDRNSEIHFKISKAIELKDKLYAVQFEKTTETIAIWDISKRIDLGASLNLYLGISNKHGPMHWSDVKGIHYTTVSIDKRNSKDVSSVAVMKLSQLEDFLKNSEAFGFDKLDCNANTHDNIYEFVKIIGDNIEGHKIETYGIRYERDSRLRQEAIAIHGTICQICGFDFEKTYGSRGEGFIEVHHLKPLCEGEQKVNPLTDLICICSNCHSMIHRKKYNTMSPEELRKIMNVEGLR